jgi:hypothetical protein
VGRHNGAPGKSGTADYGQPGAVESDGEATVLAVRSCGPGISVLRGMFRLG